MIRRAPPPALVAELLARHARTQPRECRVERQARAVAAARRRAQRTGR